jgi:hypothetical protein
MYWWDKAASMLEADGIMRFGFITTNSISQHQNRKVVSPRLDQLEIIFAIADHPWVDASDGASVRVSMTVLSKFSDEGYLGTVINESNSATPQIEFEQGKIYADLRIGPPISKAVSLKSNSGMVYQGVKLVGSGFLITSEQRNEWIGINEKYKQYLPRLVAGTDLTKRRDFRYTIDLYGLTANIAKEQFPEGYQHLNDTVKDTRLKNSVKFRREYWWVHGAPASGLREALKEISRFIGTSEVAKHRYFEFLSTIQNLADGSLAAISSDDGYDLGVLSSIIHTNWAAAKGGRMGKGNDLRYQNGPCFETFPFPPANEAQKVVIRELAERLDAHRKRQQSLHPKLTMTGMYNVLEKLRAEEPLNDKEKQIHQDGLVGILKEIHDELDAAVAQAYGWPVDLPEQEILQRLVDLNAERAAEEARGHVRWLRPEYQAPDEVQGVQSEMALGDDAPVAVVAEARKWPQTLAERATALRELLAIAGEQDLSLPAVAAAFKPKLSKTKLAEAEGLLDTLVALGQAERGAGGWHVA